jgi:hypothetical protein
MLDTFNPIFIVGTSRSGTTMMNTLLGNNELVSALNELHYLGSIWDISLPLEEISQEKALQAASVLIMHIHRGLWSGGVSSEERNRAEKILAIRTHWTYKDIYQEILKAETNSDKKFVTDQTPRNVFFVDGILELFPDARIIQMIRDPRAVLYSQRNRWKKKWLGASSMPIKNVLRVLSNYHPYTLSRLWKQSALIALKHNNNDRYKVVVFEHLVSQPEPVIKDICRFLNIEFNETMLSVPQVGSSNKTHDYGKIGITADVVDAWKRKLPKGDVYICEMIVSDLLKEFGYSHIRRKNWIFCTIGSMLRFPFHILGSMLLNPKVIYVQIRALANLR